MSRIIAYEILCDVKLKGQYANLALKQLDHPHLPLITNYVYGTLQNYDFCKYQWEHLVTKKVSKPIEVLLTFSVYQHLFVDKAKDYAIVNEALNIAKTNGFNKQIKMINALLRIVTSNPMREPANSDLTSNLAIRYSMPIWIVKLLVKQQGIEQAAKLLVQFNQPPLLYLCKNPMKQQSKKYDEMLTKTEIDGCFIGQKEILSSDFIASGYGYVQDKNAQIIVSMLQALPQETILDMCAAPGGKTIGMALSANNQAKITAIDIHPSRANLIDEFASRVNVDVDVVTMDALEVTSKYDVSSFDKVLLDAPCSGLGVMRRKPDIRHHLQPTDLDQLQALQRQLLTESAKMVKPDGALFYVTCTLNKKENQDQITWFLDNHPDFVCEYQQHFDPITSNADGFYMAKCTKIK